MIEIWKPVIGYEGLYEVSNIGRVRKINYRRQGRTKLMKLQLSVGYYCVGLCKDGKKKLFRVHRLVVMAFIGPIPKGMVVNHINENKLDNRVENLEIVTQAQNLKHGTRPERVSKTMEKVKSKKVTLIKAKVKTRRTFPSLETASNYYGYKGKSTISHYIRQAKKRDENFIHIHGEKYRFIC